MEYNIGVAYRLVLGLHLGGGIIAGLEIVNIGTDRDAIGTNLFDLKYLLSKLFVIWLALLE